MKQKIDYARINPDAIRAGVREMMKLPMHELRGTYYDQVKPFLSPEQIHDRKFCFFTMEDAEAFARERGIDQRAYRCHRCPAVHLTRMPLRSRKQ